MHALRTLAARSRAFSAQAAQRPRVVVLGSGWGGNKVARYLDKSKFDVRVVSPANHFLFTPLLPSTAVGTLEFRAVQEPVRTIAGLGGYHQAKAQSLDVAKRTVACQDVFSGDTFDLSYDFLVVSAGCKTNTFGVPGVTQDKQEAVFFLKHLYHARRIRDRILECFERAASPVATEEERRDMLHFVVVGGGATSCEFATELAEFLEVDVRKRYPDLADLVSLSIVEAGPHILGGFDEHCWKYYTAHLEKHNVAVRTGCAITAVEPAADGRVSSATLKDGSTLRFGCMVWSAGLAPIKFVEGAALEKDKGGRVVVDEYLRAADRVFALGDCTADRTHPLPPTASAAEQQGAYLAKCFNETYYKSGADGDLPVEPGPVAPSAMPFDWLAPLDNLWTKRSEFRYVERGRDAVSDSAGGPARESLRDSRRQDGVHGHVGRRGRHDAVRAHAGGRDAQRRHRVRGVARRLPLEAGVDGEHDPHTHVLAQVVVVWPGHLALLSVFICDTITTFN